MREPGAEQRPVVVGPGGLYDLIQDRPERGEVAVVAEMLEHEEEHGLGPQDRIAGALGEADPLPGVGLHLIGAVRIEEQMRQGAEGRALPLGIPLGATSSSTRLKSVTARSKRLRAIFTAPRFWRMIASRPSRSASGSFAKQPRAQLKCCSASELAWMVAAFSPALMKYSIARPKSRPRSKWTASWVAIRGA